MFIALLIALLAPATEPATQAAVPVVYNFPTYGFSITIPSNWKSVPAGTFVQAGRWVIFGPDNKGVQHMFVAEISAPQAKQSLQDYARSICLTLGATQLPEKGALGDVPAIVLVREHQVGNLNPEKILIAEKDGYFVLTMAAAQDGKLSPDLEAVYKSWKWMPREKPLEHREFRQPSKLFNTLFITLPELMRPRPTKDPGRELHYGIFNYVKNRLDFVMTIQHLPVDPNLSFAQFRDKWAEKTLKPLGVDSIEWEERPGKMPLRYISKPVEIKPGTQPSTRPVSRTMSRFALLQLDPGSFMMFSFAMQADTPEEAKGWDAMAVRITDSVSDARSPSATKPAAATTKP